MFGFWSWAATFTWSMRLRATSAFAESAGLQPQQGHDLLEAGGPELGGAIVGAEERSLDLLQQDELPELFFSGHGLGQET